MMQHRDVTGVAVGTQHSSFEHRIRADKLTWLDMAASVSCDDSPWFALRCWTGREESVRNELDGLGITSLVPMRKGPDLRRRHRLIEGQMMPVIHGYVLVRIDGKPLFLAALDAVEHAIEVLGGCEHPKRLSAAEVERFQSLAEAGEYDWKTVSLVFRKGEKVRATEGPFASFSGSVISCRQDGRGDAVVEFDVFGRPTPVTLPLAFLEKL